MNKQETILKTEKNILQEEKQILSEIKKEEKLIFGLEKNILVIGLSMALVIVATVSGLIYWQAHSREIVIDKAIISAPQIDLSVKTPGTLEEVFVNEGDQVLSDTVLARVGNELIKAKTAGLIIAVNNQIGRQFNPGEPIVSMIDPSELRVVGQIDENKGLADIVIGQAASFTVDAFGSQTFTGVVDEVNPTSNDSGVAFSISDKREVKKFDVKIRFNISANQKFKNGMSAKITIYKN